MKHKLNNHDKVELLYTLYEQKMYAVAYSILNDKWQAEDAVSESFIKIIKNLGRIKDVEATDTKKFIIRIIQHTAIDIYRKNQRERTLFTVVPNEEQEGFSDESHSIENMLKDINGREVVNRMLAKLPEKYREVINLRCVHELSVKETAAIMEISESLVRKRYERARNMLMKEMGDDQYEYKII